MIIAIKISAVIVCIIAAGFFAGSETGIYRLSALRLRLDRGKDKRRFVILEKLLSDKHSLIFTTLSGTNLAHYIATSLVTGMFIAITDSHHLAEAYSVAALTPVLFVFSEVLPKNIYFNNPDRLMPYSARILFLSQNFFKACGIIPILKFLTVIAEKATGLSRTAENIITTAKKHQVLEIIRQTHEEGILGAVPAGLISRFVSVSKMPVSAVANATTDDDLLNIETAKAGLLEKIRQSPQQYRLVYRDNTNDIIGYIDVYQSLNNENEFVDLTDFVKPIKQVSDRANLIDVIDLIAIEKIILIVRPAATGPKNIPVGFLDISDVLEEIAVAIEK